MKMFHISEKLNRTKHKLLHIQLRMEAAELKIANLTVEILHSRFLLHRNQDNFRRASDNLEGSKTYCKNTEMQISIRNKKRYNRLEKINELIHLVQQRVDAIRRVLVAAEKIRTGTIDKLGQFELPSQADMGTYDPSMGRNVRGATAGSSISSSSSITGGEATRNSSPEAVV